MSKLELTPLQWQAVGLETLDRDMCIVAGPGAGKTTVLVERFIHLVYGGGSCLDILAFTFTEKAAAQLKDRLIGAFADRPEMRPQVERAYVSTVHGFCARLLRENALAAGVDPRFRVLDEREGPLLARQAAGETLDALYEENPQEVSRLLSGLAAPDLAQTLLDLHEAVLAAGTTPQKLVGGPAPPAALEELMDAAAGLLRKPPACKTAKQREKASEILEWARRLAALRGAPLSLAHFELLDGFRPGHVRDPRLHEIREELLPAALGDLIGRWYQPQRDLLIEALVRFDCLYRRMKAAAGALDFSDLERAAVALLESRPEIRRTVRSRFRQILMDEFQDTNRQQARLVELLRSPGCFYAVGDINQSIYGFRHADPEVFRVYREATAAAGGQVVELRENFRSRPEILHAAAAILNDAPGIEPHRLVPGKVFPEKREPSVEVMVALGEDAGSALEWEAGWVARRIRELLGTPMITEWEDGRPAGRRAARVEDFAVLVRNSKVIPAFTAAFEEQGIPYMVSRGQGFYSAREVADLCRLLRVIANPRDEISLAAVLRSPLAGGVSDETLLRLKQQGNLGTALKKAAENGTDERVRQFARKLEVWRELRRLVSPDRLLARALDESGYEAALGPRARANVEKFLGMLRAAAERRSLDEMIEDLEALSASEGEPEAAVEEAARCVRIMTVHSAKGLEFPVVFLAALHKGVDHGMGAACFSPELGLGMRWHNPATGSACDDAPMRDIRKERTRKEAHESERLLYVAMTRAEEHLALSFSKSAHAPAEWGKYVQEALGQDLEEPCGPRVEMLRAPGGEELAVRLQVVREGPPAPEPLAGLEAPALAAREPLPRPQGQYDATASVTSIVQFLNCPRRYYLGRYLGWQAGRKARPSELEDLPDAPEPDEMGAAGFGRQVHAILAGTYDQAADPEAARLAQGFQLSALGRRTARAQRVEREFDFVMAVEDVVLRGQIDLWFEENGRLVLLDYKTDDVTAGEAVEHARNYALQLQLYALALERLAGRLPDEAYVYLLRPGVAVPIGLQPLFLHAAEGVVREFREAQERLDFPLREGPDCPRCPFWRGLCPAR